MRTRASSSLALLMAFALFACGGGDDGGPTTTPGPGPNGDGNGNGGTSADVTVRVDNLAFIDPDGNENQDAVVRISVGQTVGWENQDDVDHTVTSTEEPEGGSSFDEPLPVGASRTITFDTAGEWVYFCEVHPGIMVDARVIVE